MTGGVDSKMTMRSIRKAQFVAVWAVVAALVLPVVPNAATANENSGLEEITVTARKREESMQDTPVAVTAFTGENMAARGITDVSQIADFTPNMQFDFSAPITGSSNAATIFIRGVGQTDFLMTVDPGVGVYVDGVYLSRSMGSVLDLLDIDRIEVLRGPQGTLFGKNTIGGAIAVTTKRPTESVEAEIELTGGRFGRFDAKGSVNIPLAEDKLAMRLSGAIQNRDGWAKRADGVELGDKSSNVLRGTLLFQPSDSFDALLSADWSDSDEGSPVGTLLFVDPAAQLSGLYNGFVATGPADVFDPRYVVAEPSADGVVSAGTDRSGSKLNVFGTMLTVNWYLGDVTLKSITSHREMDIEFGNDADHSPLPILSTYNVMEHEQRSQEFNLSGTAADGKLDWLLGAYYFYEEGWNDTDVPITQGLFGNQGLLAFAQTLPPGPDQGALMGIVMAGTSAAGLNSVENTSYAGFAHASYHVSDRFTITAGLRYTDENKKAINRSVFKDLVDTLPPGVPIPPPMFVLQNGLSDNDYDNLSPHLNLQFQLSGDAMGYVSYSKGFKSGGVGERYRFPRPGPVSFEPEEVDSYEIGVKADLLNDRLRINAAAFFADYTDIQVSTVTDVEPLTFNAAEAEIKGIELEFIALPSDSLKFSGGIGYIDAAYTQLDPGVIISINNEFVDTPKWSANITAEYSKIFGSGSEVTMRAGYSYRDDIANDAVNTPQLMQDAYGLVNAGVTYAVGDSGLEFTLFGRNLTDERYVVTGWSEVAALGLVEGVWGRPREWGVTARYYFD